jgi:hypothetical protein
MFFVDQVIFAESFFQRPFLNQWKIDVIEQKEKDHPEEERPGLKKHGFRSQQEQDTGYHRVADIPIGAADHQFLGRVPGYWGALTKLCE